MIRYDSIRFDCIQHRCCFPQVCSTGKYAASNTTSHTVHGAFLLKHNLLTNELYRRHDETHWNKIKFVCVRSFLKKSAHVLYYQGQAKQTTNGTTQHDTRPLLYSLSRQHYTSVHQHAMPCHAISLHSLEDPKDLYKYRIASHGIASYFLCAYHRTFVLQCVGSQAKPSQGQMHTRVHAPTSPSAVSEQPTNIGW